jgi:hypothetical protein
MSEIQNYINANNLDYLNIIKLCKENKLEEKTNEYLIFEYINLSYIIKSPYNNDSIIIFTNEIKLKIIDSKDNIYNKNIRCNIEIKYYLKELNIDIKNIIINKDANLNLEKEYDYLFAYIKNGEIILEELKNEIPKLQFKRIIVNDDNKINCKDYSEYFFDYFEYEDKNKNYIKFQNNDIRENIKLNIIKLSYNENLKEYKITGPSSNGKSMTLFYISRHFYNIIYINLKVLNKNDKNKCINIIFSELSRIVLSKENIEDLNKKLESIDIKSSILEILLKIIDLILEYKNIKSLILILDQYKKKNYYSFDNFSENIESLCKKYKSLKIVYCSSINDNNLRDEVLNSFIRYDGLIKEYNEDSQKFYFYYADIFIKIKNKNKNTINWLFDNRKKYISLFKSNNTIRKDIYDGIIKKINSKIEEFNISSNENQFNDKYSLSDLFIYLRKIFNVKFSIRYIFQVLRFCPLKYVKVIFKEEIFTVKPLFPFIKYFVDSKINKDEGLNYFKEKKYNIYGFQSNRIKGGYFEYCAQI